MLQYHALGLLYHIRKSDKLAVSKLVTKFTRHSLKSPYAYCHLVGNGIIELQTFFRSKNLSQSLILRTDLYDCCLDMANMSTCTHLEANYLLTMPKDFKIIIFI
jgi:hypothetical protein